MKFRVKISFLDFALSVPPWYIVLNIGWSSFMFVYVQKLQFTHFPLPKQPRISPAKSGRLADDVVDRNETPLNGEKFLVRLRLNLLPYWRAFAEMDK